MSDKILISASKLIKAVRSLSKSDLTNLFLFLFLKLFKMFFFFLFFFNFEHLNLNVYILGVFTEKPYTN